MLFTWICKKLLMLCSTNFHYIRKNEYYEITGNLLGWIAGFLSNRRQFVVLNGKI